MTNENFSTICWNPINDQQILTLDYFKFKVFHNKPLLVVGDNADFAEVEAYILKNWGKSYAISGVAKTIKEYRLVDIPYSTYPFNYDVLITKNYFSISETNRAFIRNLFNESWAAKNPLLKQISESIIF